MWNKLGAFFDTDNPLMRALGVMGDLLLLNAVTFICMLPVITFGAALTARDDVLWHIVRGEESYVIPSYFKSFRRNLKQGILMGIVFLASAAILFFEFRIILDIPEMRSPALFAMIILVSGFVLAVGIYSFALLSRYENSVPGTIKNAVILSFAFFPRTLAMLTMIIGFWLIQAIFYQYLLPLALLLGVSLPGYLCALMYNRVFLRIDQKNAEDEVKK